MDERSFEEYVDAIRGLEESTKRLLREVEGFYSVLDRFLTEVHLRKWAPRGVGDLKVFILTRDEKVLKFIDSMKGENVDPTLILWNDEMEFDSFYRYLRELIPKACYLVEISRYPDLPIFKRIDIVLGLRFLEGKPPNKIYRFISDLRKMGVEFLFGKYELSGSRELYILKRLLERCSGSKVSSFGIYLSKGLSDENLYKILKALLNEVYSEEVESYRGGT
ncbi:MAG: hypothetical protein J7L50_01595 [Candidatus Odinarchaeota archaeon]|nr:hypothetical protein [Candidatus Odinarchaeota archaeon]